MIKLARPNYDWNASFKLKCQKLFALRIRDLGAFLNQGFLVSGNKIAANFWEQI